ncbi:MAG: hypothetical protein ACLFWL_04175 [Candidatus Brocadiia bacterium]
MSEQTEKIETEEHNARKPRKKRRWLRSVLVGAAILVCGMVIGVCLALGIVRNRVIELIHHPEKRTEVMVRRLDRKLNLSDQQQDDVREVLEKHRWQKK